MKVNTISSFFAGVGGIDLAFESTGEFKVVYANEFDKFARQTYEANFELEVDGRDIRDVKSSEVPKSDILLAGFPCQPFSVAGYRKGFEDDRGDLYFEVLRIILKNKPNVVFLENVKNMVNHDNGNTFKVIRESLEVNGYYLKWAVLNATDYGNIPQNRERIYIVGFRSKKAFQNFVFPSIIPLKNTLDKYIDFKKNVDDKYYYSVEKNPKFYHELEKNIVSQNTVYQWRRLYVRENKSGVVPTLTANMGTGGHNVPLILADTGIRKLTPRETFNVQGFPDNYILPTEVSDGQLYKQAGNSVAIPVVKRIAQNIANALKYTESDYFYESNGRYTITYTKMFGHQIGESYALGSFKTQSEVESFLKNIDVTIITDEEYFDLVKRKKENEFIMINDSEGFSLHVM